MDTTLATYYRPVSEVTIATRTLSNGVASMGGMVRFTTAGNIICYVDGGGGTAWSTGAGTDGPYGFSVSYHV